MIHRLVLLLAFTGIIHAAHAASPTKVKRLIIDTGLFIDLLAVNINFPSTYSALAASAILAHYGHDTPIGIRRLLTNVTFFDSCKVAYHWSGGSLPWGRAEDAWDPVALYRKVLSEAPDQSVTIVSIGFFDNV
ncbi:uncharacterized protein PODANS_5_12550 [Podospora anserina S mat+]|uniref:Podospora anserina S mat+ genomic DNA chromosome 5, supercontig 7 n=1 Tax=Podospora anserina (strain S / ATCC MYA-4624 / DSM 980 / FGSC 10383) TaxID=515849 RepID=B2AFT4_PODAN|nr:uncharacterized protein PODANS_5_12550 [Podospora anserina S mat+]CAP62305.1 unnamed protein product [Podospora anserina S mat+]CDP29716.1 Putative protein of unknown function [Podospora anserina S mat+]